MIRGYRCLIYKDRTTGDITLTTNKIQLISLITKCLSLLDADYYSSLLVVSNQYTNLLLLRPRLTQTTKHWQWYFSPWDSQTYSRWNRSLWHGKHRNRWRRRRNSLEAAEGFQAQYPGRYTHSHQAGGKADRHTPLANSSNLGQTDDQNSSLYYPQIVIFKVAPALSLKNNVEDNQKLESVPELVPKLLCNIKRSSD